MSLRDAVIFDMDGTLCDVSSVRHHVQGGRRDFHSFHVESGGCPPHAHVVEAARAARRAGQGVLIVTARKRRYEGVTSMWLALNDVPSDVLLMREDCDGRPDFDVKREMLARIRRSWNPVHAWDDNPAILALWKMEGIPFTRVPGFG